MEIILQVQGLKKIYTRIEKSTKGEIKIEGKITDL